MAGDPEHVAFKKLFNIKKEIAHYLEKEQMLILREVDRHLYHEKHREIKDKCIDELAAFLQQHLRGNVRSDVLIRRCVHIVEKMMVKMERLNPESSVDLNGKMISWPTNISQKPVYELDKSSW